MKPKRRRAGEQNATRSFRSDSQHPKRRWRWKIDIPAFLRTNPSSQNHNNKLPCCCVVVAILVHLLRYARFSILVTNGVKYQARFIRHASTSQLYSSQSAIILAGPPTWPASFARCAVSITRYIAGRMPICRACHQLVSHIRYNKSELLRFLFPSQMLCKRSMKSYITCFRTHHNRYHESL